MSEICTKLHASLRGRPVFSFPFQDSDLCRDGIYVLFERGERAHGGQRIVRIGTHTGDGNLCARLHEHFLNPNKDRSIFRKNIGRAILNKEKDPFLKYWNTDRTSRADRAKIAKELDIARQADVERRVTAYIREMFTFCVIEATTKIQRRRWEDADCDRRSMLHLCIIAELVGASFSDP